MIDRQKKKFIVLVIGLSLYLASVAAKNQNFSITNRHFRHRKPFTMTRKPCQDAEGNKGVCIFKWDCLSQEGVSLTTCVDGFLFGSCCKLKVLPEIFSSDNDRNENRINVTTRFDERETSDDTQRPNSVDPTGKTSSFEHYYSGVTYSFHSDDIDAKDQKSSEDGAMPFIYTLADKIQNGNAEEMGESFTVSTTSGISGVITSATDVTRTSIETLFRVSERPSSSTNDSDARTHENSPTTETYFYNNGSSLAAISSSTITLGNIPIVYTLTSQMPTVYNHYIENGSVSVSSTFDSTQNGSVSESSTFDSTENGSVLVSSENGSVLESSTFDSSENSSVLGSNTFDSSGNSSVLISSILDSSENGSVLVSSTFDSSRSDELQRTTTSNSTIVISSTADNSLMSRVTSQIPTSHVTEVTEQYAVGTSSDNVSTHSGFTGFFPILEMGETDSVINNQNSEIHTYDTIFTSEDTSGLNETTFSTVEERKKTTEVDDFTAAKAIINTVTDNSTVVEGFTTEAIPSYLNNSTETPHKASHSSNISPVPYSEPEFIQNTTQPDFYNDLDTAVYLPYVSETEVQDDNFQSPSETSLAQFDNSETTTLPKLLDNMATTTSSGGLLFTSSGRDETPLEDDFSLGTTTVHENDKLPQLINTPLLQDSNTASEKLDTVRNKTENLLILSDNDTQSYMTDPSITYHNPSGSPSFSEYNNEINNTPQYNNNNNATFDFASILEEYNSSLVTTQEPNFDSTWFLIKLSEFFWDNLAFNETPDFGSALDPQEITTLLNYQDAENANMPHVTHPDPNPIETQTHHSPPSYNISSDSPFVTSFLLGHQTDITDRDETIYQNLLSIMQYNGQTTTPVNHPQNNVNSYNTYDDDDDDDDEEQDQFFHQSIVSDSTQVISEVTEIATTKKYDHNYLSEHASTVQDLSLTDDQTDSKEAMDFVTETPDILDADTLSYTVSLTTEFTFSESNIEDKYMQITSDNNDETDTKSHTTAVNLHDVNYTQEENLVSKPQKSSLSDDEDTTSSETSKHGMDFSPTTDSVMSKTERSPTANGTESNLIPSPDSEKTGLVETSTSMINVTNEATFEAPHSSLKPYITTFPSTQEGTTTPDITAGVLADSDVSTVLTVLYTPQDETTTKISLNFTENVTTHSVITSDETAATYIDEIIADSSIASERITATKEITTSEEETTAEPEKVSGTENETPLTTASERETTTKPTDLEKETTTNPTSSEKVITTKPTILETVALSKPTTISTSLSTSPKPTYTTQKHAITQALPSPPKLDYRKNCGVRTLRPTGRIVGGTDTFNGKWPWQALVKEAAWLGLFVKNKCGGVLINSKFVITAAHCQPGFLGTLIVVLGAHDLTGAEDYLAPVARNVKRMVIHRHYNAQTFENDLALLEMESHVEFLPHVVPICLPYRYEDFTGKMAFVTGWGKLTHGGDVPNILQEVQVPIVKNVECQKMYLYAGHEKIIRSHFVCAGYSRGGQDSCEGDSGGPLMVQRDDGRWVLVGTVSHGIGCADPNLPGVYMRMSAYRPWIDSIIRRRKVVRQKQVNGTSVIRKKTRRSRTAVFYI